MSSFTSIDLFAGCGGLTRGLEDAGFKCLAFNELNKDAAASFSANFNKAQMLSNDIYNVTRKELKAKLGDKYKSIDLVCGGPPCQGFSGIGHRRSFSVEKEDIPTNHLYEEMIRVIKSIRPKAFLFENVRGLLSSKWNSEGENGEIFRQVYEAFKSIPGYRVQPTLIHASWFGVPQNRPRVMIMGLREEIFDAAGITLPEFDLDRKASTFPSQLRNNGGMFPVWDGKHTAPGVEEMISDLAYKITDWYAEKGIHRMKARNSLQRSMREDLEVVSGKQKLTDHFVSNHSDKVRERFQYMIDNNIRNIRDLPEKKRTKKFSQKLLPREWENGAPTITCCSNSDDYVHYSIPRALSVREWARLQTFPDHHEFRGPRTTGGVRRAGNPDEGNWDREVPKYTQIGNAVPPLLAKAIGEKILEHLTRGQKGAENQDQQGPL